ncbi:acyltransferase [Alloprevotella sp. Lung230]|uniref:acyltransferase family protein n=1 Tax=Alloprevotella sp. Lung230 TaxID=2766595 RepID=UPI0016551B4E|nr:acyltransferase [Alloprevotella sp. Lung230]MBC8625329.1 acyltransferase [Alloprevotella sp. Lung230]
MIPNNNPVAAFADTKPHYHLLDGLRGVAALVVICYHIGEAFATNFLDQVVNHGYLAVDFFFMLSGFVIGYAYDDRCTTMGVWAFTKRRLIRLHPMVVVGALLGALMFYAQGCEYWKVSEVSIVLLAFAMLLNMFLVPAWGGVEVRGFGEIFPLNGPTWSLFFEYIANLLYVLAIRKLSTRWLAMLVFATGGAVFGYAITNEYGNLGAGWTFYNYGFWGGLLRVMFAFPAGLLLSRVFRKWQVRGAFWWCALAIVAVTAAPRIGGADHIWANGIYEALCVLLVFPLVVCLGASGQTTDALSTRVCNFLGDISYPLYIVHYPFIYTYYAWVKNNNLTFSQTIPQALALVFGSIALAWVCLKFYDIPVRRWLQKRFV